MTDLLFVASDILASPSAKRSEGISGGVPVAGDVVFMSPDDRQWRRASNNDSTTNGAKVPSGIALNGATAGQPIDVLVLGDLTVSSVLTPGDAYYLSANPGKICPRADVVAGMDVCFIGIAKATNILMVNFMVPGVTL
jgi:hypothetical protein